MVRSKPRGRSTSAPAAEVESISPRGIWLWVQEKEYYLSFEEYPWFRQATVGQIHDVQFLHGSHLRWPALDVELELESLEHPEKYPLRYV